MVDLRCGDCVDKMKEISDNSIDLVVTSPPYDNIRDYLGNNTFDYKETLNQIYRILKWGAVTVWIVSDQTVNGSETGTSFRQALYAMDVGFKLHDTMIWKKSTFAFPDKNRYYPVFEYMFIFSKGIPKTFNGIEDRKNKHANQMIHGTSRQRDGSLKLSNGTGKRKVKAIGRRFNVWEINEEKANKTDHPAVFPVQLVQDHIITWSNKGDLILDPFMGSGTTGMACVRTGRDFIGIEIEPKYFDIAQKRIYEAAGMNIEEKKEEQIECDDEYRQLTFDFDSGNYDNADDRC